MVIILPRQNSRLGGCFSFRSAADAPLSSRGFPNQGLGRGIGFFRLNRRRFGRSTRPLSAVKNFSYPLPLPSCTIKEREA